MKKSIRNILASFFLSSIFISSSLLKAQDLGANFNENIDKASTTLITKSAVKWIRGFVNVPMYCLNLSTNGTVTGVNDYGIQTLSGINTLINAKNVTVNDERVKVIFSLKMDFTTKNMGVPASGSTEMGYVLTSVEKLLKEKNLGASIDILVVGNEPMWETPVADANNYEAFLNQLIDKVDSLKTANNWNYEIFAGSLNKASTNKTHAILQKVLKIAKENPKISGLDVHEHVTLLSDAENDIKYLRETQGFTKKMMCTEFSLVWLWDAHENDILGSWGALNGYSSTMKMYEWLNAVMLKSYAGTPVSQDLFRSYFESTSWYPKNWFNTFYDLFKKYNFSVIFYGIQNLPTKSQLTSSSALWTVNFVYNGTYLGLDSDNIGNTNPLVYPAFKTITDSLNIVNTAISTVSFTNSSYKIYPNPAKTFLNIFSNNKELSSVNVKIYNMQSEQVYSNQATSIPLKINLNEVNILQGWYLVNIACKSGNFSNKILIE
ncbi:MAG: T9SS type A sorting domain-containing protein [Paludibacter sp.]|nr:T9SS type A sorting domain-containing protein [Paludibacter sp.]